MQSIYDILLANSTLLEQYKSKGYTDTQLALENALELINARILKTNGQWSTQKLNAIKKLIEDEIAKSYGGLFASLQDESTAIAQITYNAIIGASMSASIPTALINDLTNSTRTIQGYEFKELFKLTQDNHARQLRVSLASAIGAGLIPTQITQELNKKNESLTKAQLATNVRTVIFDAANEATYKSYAKLEKDGLIDYYEYVAVLDSRTSEVCRNNDGRKFYVSIDEVKVKPPLHFNCRSKLVAGNKYSRQDGTRASQFGAVPSTETYSTWFAKQSSGFQRSVLGNTKYNSFKSGVYRVQSLPDVLGKKIGLEEIKDTMEEFVATPKVPVIDFGYDGKFNKYVEDIRDEANLIIRGAPKPRAIKLEKHGYYDIKTGVLVTTNRKTTFIHEYGHHLDNDYGNMWSTKNSDKLYDLRMKDAEKLGLYNRETREEFLNKFADEFLKFDKDGFPLVEETGEFSALSDMIDSATMGYAHKYKNFIGHGTNYYKSRDLQANEDFANMFALWSQNGKGWQKAKEFFPKLTEAFEEKINEFIEFAKDDLEDE